MADEYNNTDRNDLSKKFNSLGVSFAVIEQEERRKAEAFNIMNVTITSTIQNLILTDSKHYLLFFKWSELYSISHKHRQTSDLVRLK